jgi:hypothetical protein
MRVSQVRLLAAPAAVVAGAVMVAVALVAASPAVRARIAIDACPASSTCPTNAYLTLDVSAGPPSTVVTVSGNLFLPGETMSIYWDVPNKVIGSAAASSGGSFANARVKPFAGDPPGLHHICATVPYVTPPCVQFQLEAATSSPSPQASPVASASPSESPLPPATATPARAGGSSNGLDLFLRPPLVFVPIIAGLALLAALGYWVVSTLPRRRPTLPSATIVHKSARPLYGPAASSASPMPSAPEPAPGIPPQGPADEPAPPSTGDGTPEPPGAPDE